MNNIFYNENGKQYYLLFGKKGKNALLLDLNEKLYIVCAILEEKSWWQGSYYNDFEEALKDYKERIGKV